METTLIINPGSTSKKYAIYRAGDILMTAHFEQTEEGYGKCFEVNGKRLDCETATDKEFSSSLEEFIALATAEGTITKAADIARAAIRVVAPGTRFQKHGIIDDRLITELDKKCPAAPLHIPPLLDEIKKMQKLLPKAKHIAVSDSAFHSTIPAHARMYSIPPADAEKYDIYRFGYHGLSIGGAAKSTEALLGKMPKNMVVAHIGGGVSVAALRDGMSIDTSMGFTPASGLMMGTRSGDIDPGALIHTMAKKELAGNKAHAYIQKEGGFKGLLGSGDLRVALERRAHGDLKAEEAVRLYFYLIKREIGACVAALGGIDALVLTATASERNPVVRTLVTEGLEVFGITLDEEKNDALINKEGVISSSKSETDVVVVSTNEMEEIATIAATID